MLCPVCERRELTRVDDEEWWCFSCGRKEVATDKNRRWFLARR